MCYINAKLPRLIAIQMNGEMCNAKPHGPGETPVPYHHPADAFPGTREDTAVLSLPDLSPCDCDSESRDLSAPFLTLKCCSVLNQPSYLIVGVFLSKTNPWYFEILVLSAYKPQKFLSGF